MYNDYDFCFSSLQYVGQMELLIAINVNSRWRVVNSRDIYLYRLRVAVIVNGMLCYDFRFSGLQYVGQMEQVMAINVKSRWRVVNSRDIYLYRLRVAVIVNGMLVLCYVMLCKCIMIMIFASQVSSMWVRWNDLWQSM